MLRFHVLSLAPQNKKKLRFGIPGDLSTQKLVLCIGLFGPGDWMILGCYTLGALDQHCRIWTSGENKRTVGRPKVNSLIFNKSIHSLIHELKEEDSEL